MFIFTIYIGNTEHPFKNIGLFIY